MTRRNALASLGAIGAIVVSSSTSHAGYISVTLQHHTTITAPSGPKAVYRLYANFSEGADRVFAWGGSAQIGSTHLYTGPCTTGNFYQAPGGQNTAPSQKLIDEIPLAEWDTFATIGVSKYEQGIPFDQTTLFPAFTFISGNQITLGDKLVFANADAPQARADFEGDGDPLLRVLLMQLTVAGDEIPYGHVSLQWKNAAGQYFVASNQSWIFAEQIGRCCTPDGSCVLMYHSTCVQFANGYFLGCNPCGVCEQTCVPDIVPHPGNGTVDVDDLLAVINSWGECVQWSVCPADVAPGPYGNNVVDVDDLIAVINGWGPCQ